MKKYPTILYPLIVILILCISISCDSSKNKDIDLQVFRYNEHSNISSLDPAFARNPANIWPTNQLFNGLVQLDDALEIQEDIAKKWVYNDSTQTYTFYLRDDVFFHKHELFGKDSTRKVVAKDFVYSLNRLKDTRIASPGGWVLQNVKDYYAVNDTIFEIQLKQPFPAFLGLLAMRYCSVVPEEIVSYYGNNFRSNPIGTGPFKFKLWEENIKLVLRKNELYFEKDAQGNSLPYLEAVAISFLPDKQSEFLQFAQGKIDFISGLDASYKDELLDSQGVLRERYQQNVTMITGPYLNTEYVAFYLGGEKEKVVSPLLRKAINYGFDRQKMITYLRNGIGIPAIYGFIPMGLPGFDFIEGYDYQPVKARDLIEQYKRETGKTTIEISIGTDSNYLDMYEYIQREMEKLGIKITIDVMPASTLRQKRSSGSMDAFRASWIADYPDAENYLSLFYSKNFTPNGPNYTHFKNEQYDAWYETSLSLSDANERKTLYRKMDSLIISEAPIVPLYYDEAVRFVRKNVKNLGINPQNFLVLKQVKKE